MILVLLQFGAYREILACDGAEPASKLNIYILFVLATTINRIL